VLPFVAREGSSWPFPEGSEDRGLGGATLPKSDYPSDDEDQPSEPTGTIYGPVGDIARGVEGAVKRATGQDKNAPPLFDLQRILFFGLGAGLVIIGIGSMIQYDKVLDAAEKLSNISTNTKVGDFIGGSKASDFGGSPPPPPKPDPVEPPKPTGRLGDLSADEKKKLVDEINRAKQAERGVKSGEARRAKSVAKPKNVTPKEPKPKDVTPKQAKPKPPKKETVVKPASTTAEVDAAIAREKKAAEMRAKNEKPAGEFYKNAKRLNPDGTKDDYKGPMKP
jgi:hypothetical protein